MGILARLRRWWNGITECPSCDGRGQFDGWKCDLCEGRGHL